MLFLHVDTRYTLKLTKFVYNPLDCFCLFTASMPPYLPGYLVITFSLLKKFKYLGLSLIRFSQFSRLNCNCSTHWNRRRGKELCRSVHSLTRKPDIGSGLVSDNQPG